MQGFPKLLACSVYGIEYLNYNPTIHLITQSFIYHHNYQMCHHDPYFQSDGKQERKEEKYELVESSKIYLYLCQNILF